MYRIFDSTGTNVQWLTESVALSSNVSRAKFAASPRFQEHPFHYEMKFGTSQKTKPLSFPDTVSRDHVWLIT